MMIPAAARKIRNRQVREHYAQKPDAGYRRLQKLAREMNIPIPLMKVTLVATDADGKETGRYHGWSRTYVRNSYNMLFGFWGSPPNTTNNPVAYVDGNLGLKYVGGTLAGITDWFTSGASARPVSANMGGAVAGVSTLGIVIGTGVIPESFNSFQLATQIAHGVIAGTMSYAQQATTVATWVGGTTRQFTSQMSRVFNNNSGSSIVVSETAIYDNLTISGGSGNVCMRCRDLLASPVTVVNAGQLTVTYTVVVTWPADVVNNPPFQSESSNMSPSTLIPHMSWWAKADREAAQPVQGSQWWSQRFKRG